MAGWRLCMAAVVLVWSDGLHAARPFVTDDARITDRGACQLESWRRVERDGAENWVLPACNPGGNLELTLGGGWLRTPGGALTHDTVFQGKTLFRPLEAGGMGWGLAVGATVRADPAHAPHLNTVYAYVPASFSFRDDALVVHANLGAAYGRDEGRKSLSWGVGGEWLLGSRLTLIGEIYGDNRHTPYQQVGLRLWAVPGRLQVDWTAGRRAGGEEGWFSLGLRYLGEPFMR